MRILQSMKHIMLLLAGVLVAGCRADAPTSIASEPATERNAASATAVQTRLVARLALDDVLDRIVPTLGSVSEASHLTTRLTALREVLDGGSIEDRAARRHAAAAALDEFRLERGIDPADLDAIRLAVNAAVDP